MNSLPSKQQRQIKLLLSWDALMAKYMCVVCLKFSTNLAKGHQQSTQINKLKIHFAQKCSRISFTNQSATEHHSNSLINVHLSLSFSISTALYGGSMVLSKHRGLSEHFLIYENSIFRYLLKFRPQCLLTQSNLCIWTSVFRLALVYDRCPDVWMVSHACGIVGLN